MALNPTDLPGAGLMPGLGLGGPQMPAAGPGMPPGPSGQSLPPALLQALSQPPVAPQAPLASTPPPMLHDVRAVTRRTYKCAKVAGVPPEEFGISRLAKSIRDATYCFHHRPNRSEAELIADGYDEEQVKSLTTSVQPENRESIARDTVDERNPSGLADHHANRPVATTEHYIKLDYDGTGTQKIYRVVTAGESEQILERDGKPDIEPVDYMPFAAMTPIIITHRFFGRSVADMVLDLQRIKTSLLRGALDNIYLANNQRMEISEAHAGKNTIDDLLTNRPGGIVRTRQPGGLIPIPNSPLGQFVFPMIQYIDGVREWRTGVNTQSQGLDADALQNQTATASNNVYRAAEARLKLIARIFAETGIRDLFSLLHATIRKNDRESNTVRLRNKWVTIDPRDWKTRDEMTINVGLGSGTKVEQRAAVTQILAIQREAMQAPQLGLVRPANIYNSLKKLVQLVGLKSVDPYFHDPNEPMLDPSGNPIQQPGPPPNPKLIEAQARVQLEQTKAQADIALAQAKAEADMALAQKRAEFDQQLAIMDFQLRQQESEHKARLLAASHAFDQNLRTQDQMNKAAANGPMVSGMPLKHPAETINYKDVTDPQARADMLAQAGISAAPQPPAPIQPQQPPQVGQ